jgi:exosortase
VSKRAISTTAPELPLAQRLWIPARLKLGGTPRDLASLVLIALSIAWSWQLLVTVIARSLYSEEYKQYSHIILVPFITAYLLYLNRHAVLRHAEPTLRGGVLLAGIGAIVVWVGRSMVSPAFAEYQLSLAMLGLAILWISAFVLRYGVRAMHVVRFPFALLVFIIPLPPIALDAIVTFLQKTSAHASAVLFEIIGMPFVRDGVTFLLPGLTIQVAPECSGIRSSLALLISGLVMAYLVLRTTWARLTLALVIIPLAIVKNAVRIVLLSWLAVHIDSRFITGSALHEGGGIPIFFVSLTLLGGLAWLLRTFEGPTS